MAVPQRPRLLTFNDPHPMRIDRDLAAEIGLNESIVLLQLEYLISISSNERDGRMWTYQSLPNLQETYFPWWSVMTIQRAIKSLEEKHLIIVGNFNKLGYDRTQWFALNEEGINSLHSVAIYQNDKSIYQNDRIDHNKMINGSYQNDKTIPEITHEITQKNTQRETRAKRATPAPKQASLNSLAAPVQLYKELTGLKSVPPVIADQIAETVIDLAHWRDVVTAWCGKYDRRNTNGMLDWYLNPDKMTKGIEGNRHGRSIRQGAGKHFERATWTEDG
jgi:hypothetical protein